MEITDPIGRFFYELMTSKKPKPNEGDNKLFIWGFKYLAGALFFKLHAKYYDFWRWSTRYYPFSLLFKDRLFHYKNQSVNKFMIRLEKLINKAKLNTTILTGEYGGQISIFNGTFNKSADNTPANIELIDKVLQDEFESIYTRENKEGFRILVPTEMLVNMRVLES